MTQSFENDINNNFASAKSAIAQLASNTAPISIVQTVNSLSNSMSGKVNVSDIASTVSASSTNAVPVGAKLFYDTLNGIETLLQGV